MFRVFAALAAIAIAGSAPAANAEIARAPTAPGPPGHAGSPARLAILQLIEHDILRDDSRVFLDREAGQHVQASLVVGARRYELGLQRPSRHEFLLVIDTRDGAGCPGVQSIIVGTSSGRLYQGVCHADVEHNLRTQRAYYEAELDRLLRVFHPLLAPHATRREDS